MKILASGTVLSRKKKLVCFLSYGKILIIFRKTPKNLKYILCVNNRKMATLCVKLYMVSFSMLLGQKQTSAFLAWA